MNQYAFFVNSDACSGCKTCQMACQDKNDLRAGLHWRRVYEVTAGDWQKREGIWASTVVAYNLSVACHHCRDTVCGKSCSTEAIWKRPDGIVLIDQSRCVKCNKCVADCPYEAIRYDAATNTVGKCDFCVDYVDAGAAPVCVAACPNRALDFGELDDIRRKYGTTDSVFPMADSTISRPAVVVRPHRQAAAAQTRQPEVANWEEL
ncbi:MAG TPA: 4Fe-4S dicluster domain-containing protein [Vicinamibacterales bacterium]|jgi:anaerobic dimethyl sulfoxide reductase subunit B (iron-sulfur subunit)